MRGVGYARVRSLGGQRQILHFEGLRNSVTVEVDFQVLPDGGTSPKAHTTAALQRIG
jgi:hypothetical protein